MTKGYSFLFLIHLMVFPLSCAFQRNNPLDEGGSKFDPPKIFFNEQASTVNDRDTVHLDTVTIFLNGNREQSVFSVKLDSDVKTVDWQPGGAFGIGGLSDGDHSIIINTMYEGGEVVVSDTINFYVLTKGFKPEFIAVDDTTITSFERKSVMLIAHAEGASLLKYSWLKGEKIVTGKNTDTLRFNFFSITDTGSYKCIVSNDFGLDTSRTFILKFRALTGGVKGIVTDTADKILKGAKVILSPTDKQVTTGSDGKFEFTALSQETYTLKITLTGYEDKTVNDIDVNDSNMVDLREIKLSWIDTTTYKVVYNGNGNESGEVPVDLTKHKSNSRIAVLGNTGDLAIKGYTFSEWNTKKDGSGDSFSAEDSFTITDNVTLYAQWNVNRYTLSYNGNNNTSGSVPEDKEYDYNDKVIVFNGDSLIRAGYTYKGWNTQQNGEGKAYAAQDTFSMPDSNVMLYSQWKAMPIYKVTYNSNNADSGTVPVDSDNYYKGKEVTIAGNPGKLFKDGYSFAGWNTKADGTGDNLNAGSKFAMPDSAMTFYVKWSTNPTYSIIYHGNTNTGGDPPSTVESDSGDNVTIADSGSLVKTGYTFVEWNSKEDGSGKVYSIGEQVMMSTVNINLYAQWSKAKFTVTYHGNGSTGGSVPSSTTQLYGTKVEIEEPGTLQKTGHTFLKWNTDSLGNGLDYSPGTEVTISGNMNLYPRWKIIEYTIIFNSMGGTSIEKQSVKHGDTIVTPAAPQKKSYVLDGWFKDSAYTDEWIFSSYNVTANDTLYAKWAIKDIDGNIYTEVKIGKQVWMVENFKATRYRDGTSIPEVKDSTEWSATTSPGFCWYENDSARYKKDYGALYNWYAVDSSNTKKIAPEGWHIPNEAEWDTLIAYLGGLDVAGGKLKEASITYWQPTNGGATNESGFTALPGGSRSASPMASFDNLGYVGTWRSASGYVDPIYNSLNGWCYYIYNEDSKIRKSSYISNSGFSVRCLKD